MIPGVPPFADLPWSAELKAAENLRRIERKMAEAERRIWDALLEDLHAPLPKVERIRGLLP